MNTNMRSVVQSVLLVALAAAPAVASAQAPSRQAAASTPAQDEAIRRGAQLHDDGKFAEAIGVYEQVLAENPDNMVALYELAYSQLEQKEYAKALASATRGTTYRSDQLALFYDLIGSAHDLMGEPKKAIDAYTRGIAVVPRAATLYFNRGVTELESLKDPAAARVSFERAITLEPLQSTGHLMLGQLFESEGYPVPAFFAFSMALLVEPGGSQALRAYGFLRSVLRGGLSNDPNAPQNQALASGMRLPPRAASKTDEGDFRAIEAQIAPSHQRLLKALDAGAPELELLVQQIDGLLAQLAARDPAADRATFSGRHYLPFFVEMKTRGFVEPFVYWSVQRAPLQGAREWVQAHEPGIKAFLDWATAYKWPER